MKYLNYFQHSLIRLLLPLSLATLTISTTVHATPGENTNNVQESSQALESLLVDRSRSVSRYRTASMSNGVADRIFRDATSVLRTNDGSNDVSCDLTLRRSGNVITSNVGDGSIDSSGEFSAVLNSAGFVKVVNRINWCGRFSPNIIGCAPVPGNGMVVVRFTSSQEGILWAHEYGHTRGLSHASSSTSVMNGTIASNRRRVTSSECSVFRR